MGNAALIWLIVGLVLGVAEVLGAGGFLLGAAVAGILMALTTWMMPDLGLIPQIITYAILATVSTLIYFRFFRVTDPKAGVEYHDKVGSLVGKQFQLQDDLVPNLECRTPIEDTVWRVRASVPIQSGTMVRVVGAESMVIEIEPLN